MYTHTLASLNCSGVVDTLQVLCKIGEDGVFILLGWEEARDCKATNDRKE
jgi:hypothetical protein